MGGGWESPEGMDGGGLESFCLHCRFPSSLFAVASAQREEKNGCGRKKKIPVANEVDARHDSSP